MQDAPSRKCQHTRQTSRSSRHSSVTLSHRSSFTAGSYSSPIHARSRQSSFSTHYSCHSATSDLDDTEVLGSNDEVVELASRGSSVVTQGNGNDVSSEDEHEDGDELKPVKKEHTQDILTIFSNLCKVKFCNSNGAVEVLKGRWCNVCK